MPRAAIVNREFHHADFRLPRYDCRIKLAERTLFATLIGPFCNAKPVFRPPGRSFREHAETKGVTPSMSRSGESARIAATMCSSAISRYAGRRQCTSDTRSSLGNPSIVPAAASRSAGVHVRWTIAATSGHGIAPPATARSGFSICVSTHAGSERVISAASRRLTATRSQKNCRTRATARSSRDTPTLKESGNVFAVLPHGKAVANRLRATGCGFADLRLSALGLEASVDGRDQFTR